MLMLTNTMQTAEAVTHTTTIITKNVIDFRFQNKYNESAIRKQQCLNGTQTLHIFIYKKRMWHSHSVYIPPIAYRQNYIVLRTHHHIGCKYSQDLIITFNA